MYRNAKMRPMISKKDAEYINAAIKRLEVTQLIIGMASTLPPTIKRDAILLCLLDVGNLLNNGKYRTFTSDVFERHPQVPWPRLRNLRNDIIHNYFNNVDIACFDAQFNVDCINLNAALKAIIITSPNFRDSAIDYSSANINALGVNLNIFNLAHTARSRRVKTEVPLAEKLLALYRCINHIKSCLSMTNLDSLTNDEIFIFSLSLEFNKLIINQISVDLNTDHNEIYKLITEPQLQGVNRPIIGTLLAAYDDRIKRAHLLNIRAVDVNELLKSCHPVIHLHPVVMIALHDNGINVIAILETKLAGLIAALDTHSKKQDLLLIEIQHLIAVCNAIKNRAANDALNLCPGLIAIAALATNRLNLQLIYTTSYPPTYQQIRANASIPGTPDCIAVWTRAAHLAGQHPNASYYYFDNALRQICHERAVQPIAQALNNWPNQVVQTATLLATDIHLNRNLFNNVLRLAYDQANGQIATLALPWIGLPPLAILPFQAITDQTYYPIYNALYHQELGVPAAVNWLTNLLHGQTLQAFEADYINRLRRLSEIDLRLSPPPSTENPSAEKPMPAIDLSSGANKGDKPLASSSSAQKRKDVDQTEPATAKSADEQQSSSKILTSLMSSNEARQKIESEASESEQNRDKKQKEDKITSKKDEKEVQSNKPKTKDSDNNDPKDKSNLQPPGLS